MAKLPGPSRWTRHVRRFFFRHTLGNAFARAALDATVRCGMAVSPCLRAKAIVEEVSPRKPRISLHSAAAAV